MVAIREAALLRLLAGSEQMSAVTVFRPCSFCVWIFNTAAFTLFLVWPQCLPNHLRRWFDQSDHNPISFMWSTLSDRNPITRNAF